MSPERTLTVAGLWGAVLTAVILAMSVLLRLGTHIEAGEAVSVLPADVEQWARIAHRIAAMGVGVLAALALVALARGGEPLRGRRAVVGCIVALTLLLAIIGRYTPGYRHDLVTVVNVAGGVGLTAAFWRLWLPASGRAPGDPVAWMAFGTLLLLTAYGAATDAAAMRGQSAFGPLHLLVATVFVALVLAAAWRQRHRHLLIGALLALTGAQFTLGFFVAAALASRPIALAWPHALISLALALMLVSLSQRRRPRVDEAGWLEDRVSAG